ncbi:uncharacterized protein [Heptranchias perlo]|uniref:uncharacterized protein isoform X2 n=1 Tax=Heptranchias perlo TaxID=212740 RepID=UPI00355A56F1
MSAGLMLSFFVFLLRSVFTQRNPNHIYFLDERDDVSLKGPDNPGNDPVVWEWKPHSGQPIQEMGTFYKTNTGWWKVQWSDHFRNSDLYSKIQLDRGTINLRIRNSTFEFAGLFILTQEWSRNKILKQYEIFGVKFESSPQSAVVGSDVILSCTISKLSDTVSLQWKQRDSSQQNRRNTDQIRIKNTDYLMVRHVAVEDKELYVCEVQESGSVLIKADFSMTQYLDGENYTLYRSGTGHSELRLICYDYYNNYDHSYDTAEWTWRSHHLQNQEKKIASASKSELINVNRTYFGKRLVPTMANFNGKNFSVRIVPVLFEDAGVYTCSLGSTKYVIIKLITVKDGYTFKHTNVVIFGSLALLLIIILVVVLCLRKFKAAGLENQRQKPLQPRESREDASQLYSNANEIQQMQDTEREDIHYASVAFRKKAPDTEREDIHYASVAFRKKAPGSRHGTQGNQQSSDTNLTPSKEADSSVIYAQIAQAKFK